MVNSRSCFKTIRSPTWPPRWNYHWFRANSRKFDSAELERFQNATDLSSRNNHIVQFPTSRTAVAVCTEPEPRWKVVVDTRRKTRRFQWEKSDGRKSTVNRFPEEFARGKKAHVRWMPKKFRDSCVVPQAPSPSKGVCMQTLRQDVRFPRSA